MSNTDEFIVITEMFQAPEIPKEQPVGCLVQKDPVWYMCFSDSLLTFTEQGVLDLSFCFYIYAELIDLYYMGTINGMQILLP